MMFKKWWVYKIQDEWVVGSFFTLWKYGFFLPNDVSRCGPFSTARLGELVAKSLNKGPEEQ